MRVELAAARELFTPLLLRRENTMRYSEIFTPCRFHFLSRMRQKMRIFLHLRHCLDIRFPSSPRAALSPAHYHTAMPSRVSLFYATGTCAASEFTRERQSASRDEVYTGVMTRV